MPFLLADAFIYVIHVLTFNNSDISRVTESSDFVDTRSSGKGRQTGKG